MFIIVCDAHQQIKAANREFLDYLGAPEAIILNQSITQYLIPDQVPADSERPTARLRNLTGQDIAVSFETAELVLDSQEKQVGFAVFTDRSQVEELEDKLRQMSDAKSDFVKSLAYDLTNPLTVIKDKLRQTLDGAWGTVTDEQRTHLTQALEESERLLEFFTSLLDAASTGFGRVTARPVRMNTSELLAHTRDSLRNYAADRDVNLTFDMPAEPLFAWCDPQQYQRIVANLLSNAIKFTPPGGQIVLKVEPAPDNMVRTSVRDNGIGIPEEQQHSIFGMFEQVGRSVARKQTGSGLGLSLCKSFVELNGGQLGFESRERHGSTFYFTVPAAASE